MTGAEEQNLLASALEHGAHQAALLGVEDIPFNPVFREYCRSNSCGNYGKSWMCPPDVGEIGELIRRAKSFQRAVVYQTVSPIADSYDFQGMLAAGERHNALTAALGREWADRGFTRTLHLGAGGCRMCPVCAKAENLPCRRPKEALASLEAYGVDVSILASRCGMKYIHGPDTVTYFSVFLFAY